MADTHTTISLSGLDTPVPDMTGWTQSGLVRWYTRTRSMRNREAVWRELERRGNSRETINAMLTQEK